MLHRVTVEQTQMNRASALAASRHSQINWHGLHTNHNVASFSLIFEANEKENQEFSFVYHTIMLILNFYFLLKEAFWSLLYLHHTCSGFYCIIRLHNCLFVSFVSQSITLESVSLLILRCLFPKLSIVSEHKF